MLEQFHSIDVEFKNDYQSKSNLDDQYNEIRNLVLRLDALLEIQIVVVDNSRATAWLTTYRERLQEIRVATEEFYMLFLKELKQIKIQGITAKTTIIEEYIKDAEEEKTKYLWP